MRIALILSLLLLGACSPMEKDPNTVRLSSWVSSPSETRLLKQILQAFSDQNENISIKHEPIPGNYSEKIQLMLGTYTAPDIFYLKGEFAPSYIRFNILKPLNNFADNAPEFDLADFFPSLLNAFRKDSVYYGFPKDFNPYVLYYNKRMFTEAGIDAPPQNWQELAEISRRLTMDKDGNGEPEQWGLVYQESLEMLMPFVFQNEGSFQNEAGELAITEPAFIEALEYYYGLYQQGIATLPAKVGTDWNGDAFGRQKCAMIFAGAWAIPFLKDNYPEVEYEIAYMPAGKKQATVAFTTAYVMPEYCDKPEKTWEVMRYLTGKEGMARWTRMGLALPARRSVAHANGFYEDPVFKHFIKSADFAHVFQVDYVDRWYDEAQTAMQKVFFLNQSPIDAMTELKKRLERYKIR